MSSKRDWSSDVCSSDLNLFTLDSKGNYRKLKKNTNETKRLYKYYGLDKKKYYHYEHRFEELCNIVDSRVKTTISNFILLVSAIPDRTSTRLNSSHVSIS